MNVKQKETRIIGDVNQFNSAAFSKAEAKSLDDVAFTKMITCINP